MKAGLFQLKSTFFYSRLLVGETPERESAGQIHFRRLGKELCLFIQEIRKTLFVLFSIETNITPQLKSLAVWSVWNSELRGARTLYYLQK